MAQGIRVAVAVTESGQLQGMQSNDVLRFMGIPYAAPPIGELRWRAPQPPASWAGVKSATSPGPICIQQNGPSAEKGIHEALMDEDCLYLNVWAPASGSGKYPVMVWIHGGAFRGGAGSLPIYDGAELAKQGVIVVTLNYRLGALGTLALPELRLEGGGSGNFGLQDQEAALRWVKRNIAAFGGDPSNVTLFGESAGGASALYQLSRLETRGLYSRVIVESGAIDLPDHTQAQADAIGKAMVSRLFASPSEGSALLRDLRALPAQELLKMPLRSSDTMPFMDGVVVKQPIRESFEAGAFVRVPLIIGRNNDEAAFFPKEFWSNMATKMGAAWPGAKALANDYALGNDTLAQRQVAGLLFVGVNSRAIARAASAQGVPVYVYRFAQVHAANRHISGGAIHTGELPYVFGTLPDSADHQDGVVSDELKRLWTDFAKGRDLTLKWGEPWPSYAENESLLCIEKGGFSPCIDSDTDLLDYLDKDWSFSVN